jgi:CRISPR-associated protein Csm3
LDFIKGEIKMKIVNIKGQIELLSGLHIGGGDDTMKIGGIDNGVIKDINTDKPYIPGSSLKGKMRSLLEWNCRVVGYGDGSPFNSKLLSEVPEADKKDAETLLKLFGDKEGAFGITRISVGDCSLNESSEDMVLSEAKYENVINRQKGTAEHPRQTERVPAGVKFDFDIRVKVLDEDDEEALIGMVKNGLDLVANDYLGGSGSRGYGRVRFLISE